ncbi:MAG: ATP-binding protein [Bdellovibrionota bacterium]
MPKKEIARYLVEQRELIMNEWVALVRKNLEAANGVPQFIIRNSIPSMILSVAERFDPQLEVTPETPKELGAEHGEQRSVTTDFDLSDILKEYSALRIVINNLLNKNFDFSIENAQLVARTIDEAMFESVKSFAATHEKNTLQSLVKENRTLSKENDSLVHLAKIAAHDLKSPLATIESYISTVSLPNLDEDTKDIFMQRACETAKRMRTRIDNLLISEEGGSHRLNIQQVSPESLLQEVLADLHRELEISKAKISHHNLGTADADPELLKVVLQNLILNSIKYRSDEEPEIRIEEEADDQAVTFHVKDNGRGILPTAREQLFRLFERGSNGNGVDGYGIGLATAKRIVDRHGGKIWFSSNAPLPGSCFSFALPLSQKSSSLSH